MLAHIARSTTATRFFARFSKYAAVSPVMPPPMTQTSTCRSRSSAGKLGIRAVSANTVVSKSFSGYSSLLSERSAGDNTLL
jgi:hypothetical protein